MESRITSRGFGKPHHCSSMRVLDLYLVKNHIERERREWGIELKYVERYLHGSGMM